MWEGEEVREWYINQYFLNCRYLGIYQQIVKLSGLWFVCFKKEVKSKIRVLYVDTY